MNIPVPALIKQQCDQRTVIDELFFKTFRFNQTESNLAEADFVSIQLSRNTTNPLDQHSEEGNFLGARIIWEVDNP